MLYKKMLSDQICFPLVYLGVGVFSPLAGPPVYVHKRAPEAASSHHFLIRMLESTATFVGLALLLWKVCSE